MTDEPREAASDPDATVLPVRPGSWARRNRVGLALLPVAVLAALAGNAQRLQTLWWENDLRAPQRPDAAGVVRFVDEYDDGHRRYPITPALSLVSVERATTVPGYDGTPEPVTLASGGALWKVVLHVEADPQLILGGCQVALVDAAGTRWQNRSNAYISKGAEPPSGCVPADRPGPSWSLVDDAPTTEEGEERPAAYDVASWVVTEQDAAPTEVFVWWDEPRFAALPIGPDAGGEPQP